MLILLPVCAIAEQNKIVVDLSVINEIKQAHFYLGNESTPPMDVNWEPLTLPDIWPAKRYESSDNGWYRLIIPIQEQPERALGILLSKVNMNAAVYINGEFLGGGGTFEEPMARNWSKPLYFTIPAQMLRQGDNLIHIRLKSYPAYGQLSRIHLGPNQSIIKQYNKLYFFQVTITSVMLMGLLVLAFVIFNIWLRRHHSPQYFWFMVNIIAWSVLPLNMITTYIPVATKIWEWLCHSAIALWVVAFTLFVHYFIQKPIPRLHQALLVYFALVATALALVPLEHYQLAVSISYSINLLIGIYAILRLIFSLARKDLRGTIPLMVCSIILLGLSAHDWAVQTGQLYSDSYFPIYLNYLIMPIFLLFIAWYLMDEFIRSLNEVEHLNTNLESKIASARAELEEKYKTIQNIQTEQKLYEERQRLSREIHDGVSGSLANSLMLVDIMGDKARHEPDLNKRLTQLKTWLQNSLSDIRGLIFSLDTQELTGLEIFHYIADKYRDMLNEIGIHLILHIEQDGEYQLSRTQSLNTIKVLQEAMNNVIKHSDASQVDFSIKETSQSIYFSLSDNGDGFIPEDNRQQHGINNMRKRCDEIRASFDCCSEINQGTRIELGIEA